MSHPTLLDQSHFDPIINGDLDQLKHVLWHFGWRQAGQEPGHFEAALLSAIARADAVNRIKLAQGFPEYVALVILLRSDPDALGRALARVEEEGGA